MEPINAAPHQLSWSIRHGSGGGERRLFQLCFASPRQELRNPQIIQTFPRGSLRVGCVRGVRVRTSERGDG